MFIFSFITILSTAHNIHLSLDNYYKKDLIKLFVIKVKKYILYFYNKFNITVTRKRVYIRAENIKLTLSFILKDLF
jgi:hypothetical protein